MSKVQYEQDYRFYYTVWELADHSLMLEVVSSLRARISRFLYEANGALPAGQLITHMDSLDNLIEIIKNGDVAITQDEMIRHMLGAKDRIVTYL